MSRIKPNFSVRIPIVKPLRMIENGVMTVGPQPIMQLLECEVNQTRYTEWLNFLRKHPKRVVK